MSITSIQVEPMTEEEIREVRAFLAWMDSPTPAAEATWEECETRIRERLSTDGEGVLAYITGAVKAVRALADDGEG